MLKLVPLPNVKNPRDDKHKWEHKCEVCIYLYDFKERQIEVERHAEGPICPDNKHCDDDAVPARVRSDAQ